MAGAQSPAHTGVYSLRSSRLHVWARLVLQISGRWWGEGCAHPHASFRGHMSSASVFHVFARQTKNSNTKHVLCILAKSVCHPGLWCLPIHSATSHRALAFLYRPFQLQKQPLNACLAVSTTTETHRSRAGLLQGCTQGGPSGLCVRQCVVDPRSKVGRNPPHT